MKKKIMSILLCLLILLNYSGSFAAVALTDIEQNYSQISEQEIHNSQIKNVESELIDKRNELKKYLLQTDILNSYLEKSFSITFYDHIDAGRIFFGALGIMLVKIAFTGWDLHDHDKRSIVEITNGIKTDDLKHLSQEEWVREVEKRIDNYCDAPARQAAKTTKIAVHGANTIWLLVAGLGVIVFLHDKFDVTARHNYIAYLRGLTPAQLEFEKSNNLRQVISLSVEVISLQDKLAQLRPRK